LDHARGQAAVVIDSDLQDPPELIPELVAKWREGYDTVFARRRRRAGESWAKRATARAFYALMRRVGHVRLPPDTGDFRLVSRRVLDALAQVREHHRFMKGLFA
jgi:glycosyltransferase involved in cell wall biosynthesis